MHSLCKLANKMAASLSDRLKKYIEGIPKAELHIHIEGTLEPDLMFKLARRNGIQLEGTIESHKEKRKNFKVAVVKKGKSDPSIILQDLQDFLDLYYQACSVLLHEQDFYDLMYSYLEKAASNNVKVAEIFFDPQTHTGRNVPFEVVVNGLHR